MIFDIKALKIILENALIQHDIPGLEIAIDYEDQNIFSLGLGTSNLINECTIKPDTIFGVASLTKMLTTLIVLKAEELRLITLSDSLSDYYPNLRLINKNSINIRNLLNHSAGLPGLPTRHKATDLNFPSINPQMESVASLIEYLNTLDFELLDKPGLLLSYSNEGYCLLGGIIEQIFDKPYALVAEELVFKPLKMQNSFIGRDKNGVAQNIADPIVSWHQGERASSTEYWDAPLFYPAGGLMSSAKDINKLISALSGSSDFLKSDQYEQVTFDPMSVASRHELKFAYGLGIEIEYINSQKTLLWHTGQRPGISSFAGQVIQDRISVTLLTNVADAPTSSIGRLIFSQLLCQKDKTINLNWPPTTNNPTIEEKDLKDFTGIYGSPEVGQYKVYLKGEKILMQFMNSKKEMFFKDKNNGTVGVQTFDFIFKNNSKPYALALDLRILLRLI